MAAEKDPKDVTKKDFYNLKNAAVRQRLRTIALSTYEELMLNGSAKGADRKQAADAVMEILGEKRKDQMQQNTFNLSIPPEYFKRVFGEGLPQITQAEEAPSEGTPRRVQETVLG